jgi:hypothetical protein
MTGRTHRNDRLSWPRRTKTSTCPAVRSAVARSGRQSVGTGADEQGSRTALLCPCRTMFQPLRVCWFSSSTSSATLVGSTSSARRQSGKGTEVDGAPVHAVRDRQDLWQSAACHAIRHAAFLAVRREATADITLECRPHAGGENRHVRHVVVDEQGQR